MDAVRWLGPRKVWLARTLQSLLALHCWGGWEHLTCVEESESASTCSSTHSSKKPSIGAASQLTLSPADLEIIIVSRLQQSWPDLSSLGASADLPAQEEPF